MTVGDIKKCLKFYPDTLDVVVDADYDEETPALDDIGGMSEIETEDGERVVVLRLAD